MTDTVEETTAARKRKLAWSDDDDDLEIGSALDNQGRKLPKGELNDRSKKYSDLLIRKYNSVRRAPSWASFDKPKSDSDSEDEVLQTCGYINKSTKSNLPQTLLEFKKLKDINQESYSEGPFINCVEFHPTSTVCLIAGNSQIASLYTVDGKRNKKLHSISFQNFPILCAKFAHNGNEIILGSRHKHIFTFDLLSAKALRVPLPSGLTQCKKFVTSPDGKHVAIAGKWGEVYLLDVASKEKIVCLKQDSEVTALCYNATGNLLFGHSDSGEVTVWDMNMHRTRHIFLDDGCLQGSALTLSESNQFMATGSTQGVVNVYNIENVLTKKTPRPEKVILNLTTSISDLKFNSTSEILAMSSSVVTDSVKLYHVGGRSIFKNFPLNSGNKLGFITAMNFSPSGGYFAFGNKQSIVHLFRLKHYKSY